MQKVNLNSIQSRQYRLVLITVVLSLFVSCLCQCSNDDTNKEKISPEAYLKLDSTFVGIRTIASDLNEPWEITWGPDGWIWMTEHGGTISKINPQTGKKKVLLKLQDIYEGTTPGLLGMDIYPDQKAYPYLFLVYNSKNKDIYTLNLMRYTIKTDTLINAKKLLEIPSAEGHVGSRLKVSPDGKVMVTTGDAERGMSKKNAQNVHSLVGKVLRINIDGTIPKDNPFPGSPVWAWGFRNQMGLTFNKSGLTYGSMNGPASDDEINLIKKRGNYGWPNVNGYCDKKDEQKACTDSMLIDPVKTWTPTIAPAGITFYNASQIPAWKNSLMVTTLKDASLHVLSLNKNGTFVADEQVFLKNKYGRLRDVTVSPAGDIYISTSNRDWNPRKGFPKPHDDRILCLFKVDDENRLKGIPSIREMEADSSQLKQNLSQGALLYQNNCQSCHKANGKGIKGTVPPLSENKFVNENRKNLISLVLNGTSKSREVNGVIYSGEMPAFHHLSNREVAQILTYIRSNFENDAAKVSEVLVKRVRDGKDRKK